MPLSNPRHAARLKLVIRLFAASVVAVSIACATSPRGRKQLVLVPEGQLTAMGAQAFTDMKKQTTPSTDPTVNAYVKCVTDPLVRVLEGDKAKTNWELVVFKDDKTVNAFALPGGKIGVYTGLLKVAETPAQLAAVIGHEIGHVIAKHGNERVSEQLATAGGLAILGAALTERGPKYQLLMGALGVGAQFGVLLPHGRAQESEADLIGLEMMAKAGFDPSQAVELWRNMAKAGGGGPPEFLSTHPSHETRIANLQRTLAEVQPDFEATRGQRPECKRP